MCPELDQHCSAMQQPWYNFGMTWYISGTAVHGTAMGHMWYSRDTAWYNRGITMVQPRYSRRTDTIQLWYIRGIAMVQPWLR